MNYVAKSVSIYILQVSFPGKFSDATNSHNFESFFFCFCKIMISGPILTHKDKQRDNRGQNHNRFDQLQSFVSWLGFTGVSDSKESSCNAGDVGLIPGLGRSPGERNGYPFQYSCLENYMDSGVWWDTVHGVTKSWT